jgi:hypothetical protein
MGTPAPATTPTTADLWGLIGVKRAKIYQVAAAVSCHPTRLSGYLHGRSPMPPSLAQRLQRTLEEWPTR